MDTHRHVFRAGGGGRWGCRSRRLPAVNAEPPTVPVESIDPEFREKLEQVIGDEVGGLVLTRDGQPYLRVTSLPAESNPYAGRSFKWLLLNGPGMDDLELPPRTSGGMREIDL